MEYVYMNFLCFRGKGKKRGSLFRNRFAPSAKTKPKDKVKGDEKDGKIEERRPSKDKSKEDKKMKSSGEEKKMKASAEEKKVKGSSEEKKRSKSKEREKLKKKAHTIDVPYVKPGMDSKAVFTHYVVNCLKNLLYIIMTCK